ncbi:MAG: hypothetical protein WD929_01695 [Steroidobacteraceae bacterium]
MSRTRWTPLPSHSVVTVTGRDARTFLQGQLTNDLLGLDRHPGLLAACCNRQGRVLATMRLAADGEAVQMVIHRKLAATLIGHLSGFVLRADVRFEDLSSRVTVAGLLHAEPDPHWSPAAAASSGLAMMVASPRRMLLAGLPAAVEQALARVDRGNEGDWRRLSIADGEPLIQPESAALWLPQMLNLDLLGAVSFSKGCYVGQEIVARAQHLGRIKRRMLRFVGPPGPALEPGHALFSGDALAAQVVTAIADPESTQCLAVTELRYCGDLLVVRPGGTEFVPADLPYTIPAPAAVLDD